MAVLVGAGLAGCGEKHTTSTQTGGAGTRVAVSETQFKLTPSKATIAKAGAVQFDVRNAGSIPHALKIQAAGGGTVSTAAISPGKGATLTAKLTKGTYVWFCPIDGHRGLGMKGTITVAGGGAGGSVSPGSGAPAPSPGTGGGGGATSRRDYAAACSAQSRYSRA